MKMIEDMKLSRKLGLGFVVLILISAVTAFIAVRSIGSIEQSNVENKIAYQAENTFRNFTDAVNNQRNALLFFLISADRESLLDFYSYGSEATRNFEAMKEISKQYPQLAESIGPLEENYETWMNQYAGKQVELMRNYLTVNEARAIEASGGPQAVFTAFVDAANAKQKTLTDKINTSIANKESVVDMVTATIVASVIVTIVVAIILAFSLTRMISGPVTRLTGIMGSLSKGELDVNVKGAERRDEIGTMARSVEIFKNNALEVRRLEDEQKRAREKSQEDARLMRTKLADNFSETVGTIVEAVSTVSHQVHQSANGLSQSAEQNSERSVDVAGASEQASANVQTVATAADQLSTSVKEINERVLKTAQMTSGAVGQVESTNQKVNELSEAAIKIGEVINLISDIAGQTNLLALNATIEAARAGDTGKGFAVVASEVKNLASQTAKATDEIAAHIGMIQASTEETVGAMNRVAGTITEVNEITADISRAINEQEVATEQIASNVVLAATGTESVTTNINVVRETALETGQSANILLESSNDLMDQSSRLRNEVDNFLEDIRSAAND